MIDIRERALDIVPQSAITRDNVSVEVSGNLFVSVVDPEKAAYGARNPLYSVMMVSSIVRFNAGVRHDTEFYESYSWYLNNFAIDRIPCLHHEY